MIETLKIELPPARELDFYKIAFFELDGKRLQKLIQKSMDFEVENQKNRCNDALKKQSFFNMDFSSILTPFWEGSGSQMEAKMDQRWGN